MKTKITLSLDSEILRKVRTIAAEKGSSISELLAAQFADIVLGGPTALEAPDLQAMVAILAGLLGHPRVSWPRRP